MSKINLYSKNLEGELYYISLEKPLSNLDNLNENGTILKNT